MPFVYSPFSSVSVPFGSTNWFGGGPLFKKAIRDPELLTYLGATDNTLLDFTSGQLTDISQAKNISHLENIRNSLDVLHQYSKEQLTSQERLTYDILENYLQTICDDASFGFGTLVNTSLISSDSCPYPANQLFGVQNFLPDFMVNMHQVIDKKSARNYIGRLSQWNQKFTDLVEELDLREKNGVVPPRFVIEKVLDELVHSIEVPFSENWLFTSFRDNLKKLDLKSSEREELEQEAFHEIEISVYPGYSRLIAFLEKQKGVATEDAGVWKLPNGDAYYRHTLKYHTTTDESPDAIHAYGLVEVARIQGEMRSILDQLGYENLGIGEAMQALGEDPRFLYPETEEGRAQVLEDFRAIFVALQDKLPDLFSQIPKGELKIEAIPEFRAKTSSLAYYQPGDLSGKRPGIFFVNCQNLKGNTKFTMPTLAYHEGLPGHHLQCALALEIDSLPTFRRVVPFNAYQEGWALYCEQLAFEEGLTADPYFNLGRLQYELMRSVRLVVDTGIHWKRWSREKAIQYMASHTGMNEEEVVVEIERYIVLPGQACGYKIGMKKILDLREEMKEQMGAGFDIRLFHQLILENGAMPLSVLESHLRQAIPKKAL